MNNGRFSSRSSFCPMAVVLKRPTCTKQFENINEALRRQVRVREGRNEEPSLATIDSQSVKAANTAGERGYDAGKKINGIKRHFLVDVLGLLICIVVHSTNIQERDGAKLVLEKMSKQNLPRLKKVLADSGYSGEKYRLDDELERTMPAL
jgi:putative transposase